MARDGKNVLTLWEQTRGRFKKRRPGLHHLVFETESAEELNRIKGILDNLGARWSEGARLYTEHSETPIIQFEDPDGILIEVFGPNTQNTAAKGTAQNNPARTALPQIADKGSLTLACASWPISTATSAPSGPSATRASLTPHTN
jgi:catechol-2,3-dioxygenase